KESGGGVKKVGESLSLSCKTSGFSFDSYWMYWYRQPPGKEPQLVAYIDTVPTPYYADSVQGRATISRNNAQSSLHLQMQNLKLKDSAVYYCCILRFLEDPPTSWVTDKLIFGKGTKLTVEAGNQDYREPSVFLLKNESTYACVANNFYPKNAKIHMKLPGKKTITNIEHKAVTSDGKYSMVQITEFESDGAVNCTVEHEGKYVTPQQDKEKTDDSKTKTDKGMPREEEEEEEFLKLLTQLFSPTVRSEVVNTLSVTVLGLRVIFAKSVTLNLLLTAKYFFF
uniref:Ig-like domain-containing protein n=1 Tax=Ornithorhynchus anatinus TaxID=9258 RepID=F6ZNU9_ORNAN